MMGIPELDQQKNTEEEIQKVELIITEKEKIITSDRDLRAEPQLTPEEIILAKQQAILGAGNAEKTRLGSSMSMASANALSRYQTSRRNVRDETAEQKQKRIYSNYEFLLERENAKSSHAA